MSAATFPTRTSIANLPLHYGKVPPWLFDRKTYDQSIELLRKAINRTKLGIKEKNEAMRRLERVRRG